MQGVKVEATCCVPQSFEMRASKWYVWLSHWLPFVSTSSHLLICSLLKDSWFLILLDATSRHGSKIKHAVHSKKKKQQQHFATTATTIAVHTVSTAQAFKIIWLGVMVLHYITYFINYFNVHQCSLNRIQVDRHPQRFPYSPRRETLMQEVGILNFEHSQLYRAGPHVWSIPEAHYYTQDNIITNITWTFLCLTLCSCCWLCTVLVALFFGLMQWLAEVIFTPA